MIRVRLATSADQPRLVEFIRNHWSATHIFTEHPEVFAWQHLQDDDRFNMVVAEKDDGAELSVLGVLGFIPMGRFSPPLSDADLMLAIWKVSDGAPPGLGLRLLKFLKAELSPRLIAAIGTSKMVRPIYEVLGYTVGSLRQVAIFNPTAADTYQIASSVPAEAFAVAEPISADILHLVPLDEDIDPELQTTIDGFARAQVPAKDWAYLVDRYLRHPWYGYRLRTVIHHGTAVAVMVWREVNVEAARALRIVDIIGDVDWLADSGPALQAETIRAGAEHIDLVYWGIDEELLTAGGFVGTATHPDLIVPNYFSPFEQRNVEIELAYKVTGGSDVPVRLFRADSDQDRPNRPSELARPD